MSELANFCRQVRSRSAENGCALRLLHQSQLYGNVISVLRQELDSMVRVIYLLSILDFEYRNELISRTVAGRGWRSPTSGRITDKEMVDLAATLHGWTQSVYQFGCAFIHLSNLHGYRDRDPLQMISDDERGNIINHLRFYHGGPQVRDPTFDDIVSYLPAVFDKIASNLECYVKDLESGKTLDGRMLADENTSRR